ncbi:MAG TPA: ABC transporter [Erysipelotrichaceae bacterium]|nr:ABC transporter [Erysipelotrichaceae bacterium]
MYMSVPMGKGPMGAPVEKPRDTKKVLRRLFVYVKELKWMFLAAIILTISANMLQLLGPALTGQIIDAIKGAQYERIPRIIILMIIFYVISSVFLYMLQILMIHVSQKIVKKMRQQLFDKFMDLPVNYFDSHQIGDMISRISYDIDTINTSLSSDLVQLFGSLITVLGALLMMILISPILLMVFVITIPASIYTTRYLAKKTRPLFRKRSAKLGDMNGFVEETLSGLKTIKAYSQEETMFDEFKAKNREASEAYYQADYYGGITGPSIGFINNISLALISMFGSLLFLYQLISIGNISSFILYSRRFSGPISEAANMVAELQSTLAASERVFRVLDEPIEQEVETPMEITGSTRGEIEFKDVHFSYIKDVKVIENLNLHVQPGQLVAIVGPTGAGKTTMINLLMRFYDVDQGQILLDGVDIANYTRSDVRKQFGMVLQDTWLFHGTIFENIAYGHPEATLEDVIEIAREVKIHHFITGLKDGYHTILSDDGVNISKGQKQLMTIARAMLQQRPMIILDEATSNVDTRTESMIQSAMRKLMQDKTCFVIAHRLSTIVNADVILVVDRGKVVESGTHDQLMSSKGYYYQLYMAQFD